MLSLALLLTVTFVLVSIGTYECVAYGHADCEAATRCVTPCAVFIAVEIWPFAATAVSMVVRVTGVSRIVPHLQSALTTPKRVPICR